MLFSQTVEYALRAVVFLATQENASSTTEQIAKTTQVPAAYLSKVIQALRRAGIVKCVRGIGGGVNLQRTLKNISVLDVINAVEPLQRIHQCPLGLAEHRIALCPLHAAMDQVLADIESRFRSMSLDEVTRQGGLAISGTSTVRSGKGSMRSAPRRRKSTAMP